MSIKDAVDLNVVLRYLLAIPRGHDSDVVEVTREDGLVSARRLIGRAHDSLSAGLRPDQVEKAWPGSRPPKKGAPK